MIIPSISYNVDPTALTVGLGALLGVLMLAIILALGLLYLKCQADKKRMSQDTYVYIKREKAIKEEQKLKQQENNNKNKQSKQPRQKHKKKKKFEIVYNENSNNIDTKEE